MANTQKIAGVDSYVLYAKETEYGTPIATTDSNWSYIQSFSPSIKNNMISTRGFVGSGEDARAVSKFSPGELDISWTMDLIPNDFSFLEYVLGAVSTAEAVHTFTTADRPSSFTMTNNINNDTTDRVETYSGNVVNAMTLKAAVGEALSVNMSGVSNLISYDSTLQSAVANDTLDIWTFQHGSLNIDGAVSNIIDSVELTVSNNWEVKYGLGSRLVQTAIPKARDIGLKFTVKYLDDTLYAQLLGAATPAAAGGPTPVVSSVLTFTNGAKSLTITVSNGVIEEFNETNNLNDLITEDFTLNAKGIGIVWDNS